MIQTYNENDPLIDRYGVFILPDGKTRILIGRIAATSYAGQDPAAGSVIRQMPSSQDIDRCTNSHRAIRS